MLLRAAFRAGLPAASESAGNCKVDTAGVVAELLVENKGEVDLGKEILVLR
jgi:hypothetical protein